MNGGYSWLELHPVVHIGILVLLILVGAVVLGWARD